TVEGHDVAWRLAVWFLRRRQLPLLPWHGPAEDPGRVRLPPPRPPADAEAGPVSPRPRVYRAGIVALLAAYACFAWPGLYHLAAHVLKVGETLEVGPWTIHRAWLYPAAVDGGIFVAGCILLTQPQLVKRLRRELWAGMWTVAALSGLGLYVDELQKGMNPWVALLVWAPVVIATWFLHMVVRVQAEAAGDAAGKADVREEESADGSGGRIPAPGSSAPDQADDRGDDLDGEFEALIEAIRSNGHGGTKTEKAIALIGAYGTAGRDRPSISQLAKLTGCSTGIAQKALVLTREK
ncbi:MAG TPA: hypothetical protein VF506_14905, partial [Streptosporangiaceae bacterium]